MESTTEVFGTILVSRLLSSTIFNTTTTDDSDNSNNGNTPMTSRPVPGGFGSNDMGGSNGTGGNDGNNTGREAYEFVAFLLWYLFLVLCCVLPTCCAYRRRRLMEARLAQQQANFDQIHQQNVFILSNLHLRQGAMGGGGGMRLDLDSEEARAERTKRITVALKSTTFYVDENDITVREPDVNINKNNTGQNGDTTNYPTPEAMIGAGSLVVVDEEMGAAVPMAPQEELDNFVLTLPSDAPNGSRGVPGGCAICLCPYEEGDQVSWSNQVACQHAFHQECIVPWLAKKEEPKCPCCRQDFCMVEPLTPADLAALASASGYANHQQHHHAANSMSPFGLIPTSFMGLEHHHHHLQHALSHSTTANSTMSPDLTASQIVTEEGVVSFPPSSPSPPAVLDANATTASTTTTTTTNSPVTPSTGEANGGAPNNDNDSTNRVNNGDEEPNESSEENQNDDEPSQSFPPTEATANSLVVEVPTEEPVSQDTSGISATSATITTAETIADSPVSTTSSNSRT